MKKSGFFFKQNNQKKSDALAIKYLAQKYEAFEVKITLPLL